MMEIKCKTFVSLSSTLLATQRFPGHHQCPKGTLSGQNDLIFRNILFRGAESCWGCSDSDSGLLIDSDSDSGSDTKYRINNTLIVERVSAVQARKRNVTFPIGFGFHSFGRKIFIPIISHTSRIASAPLPLRNCGCQIIYLFRSCSCEAGGVHAPPRRRPA